MGVTNATSEISELLHRFSSFNPARMKIQELGCIKKKDENVEFLVECRNGSRAALFFCNCFSTSDLRACCHPLLGSSEHTGSTIVPLYPVSDFPLPCHLQTRYHLLSANALPAPTLMSYTRSTSSSNFQLILNNALKAYEKHTKYDLLAHPPAAELQSCDSLTAILTVLQQQVQDLNLSQRSNEGLTKFLG